MRFDSALKLKRNWPFETECAVRTGRAAGIVNWTASEGALAGRWAAYGGLFLSAALLVAPNARGYVIETGRIVLHDAASVLRKNERVRKAYLGEE